MDAICSWDSANAIRHLASVQHMKNLRHFFWKYGAAADQLDAFMFSDDDVTKVIHELCLFYFVFACMFGKLRNNCWFLDIYFPFATSVGEEVRGAKGWSEWGKSQNGGWSFKWWSYP